MRTIFILLAVATACIEVGYGAEISVVPTGTELPIVVISGEIEAGDGFTFQTITASLPNVAVLFDSPGGSLMDGLQIGRTISAKGFATGVPPETVCASACALAWAAGSQRFMAPTALVGFHAAYYEGSAGQAVTSSVGNALVGAYLAEIGFTEAGIIFATIASPDGIRWLDLASARDAGIAVNVLSEDGTQVSIAPSQDQTLPLTLPTGYRWIVLASARSIGNLPAIQNALSPHQTMTVSTSTGYYALVVGPFTEDAAARLRVEWISSRRIPSDAYLSSGNGFLSFR